MRKRGRPGGAAPILFFARAVDEHLQRGCELFLTFHWTAPEVGLLCALEGGTLKRERESLMSVKRGWPSGPVFTGFSLGKRSKGDFSHRLARAAALFVLVGVFPTIMIGSAAGSLADTPGRGSLGMNSGMDSFGTSSPQLISRRATSIEVASSQSKGNSIRSSMEQVGMAAVGMAEAESELKESDLDNRNAVPLARPLQNRTRTRIEPIVQGAAMEIAIGLPRE